MDGSSLPPSWGSRSGRAVCIGLLCALLLLSLPGIANGQPVLKPTLKDIERSLLEVLTNCNALEQALAAQRLRINEYEQLSAALKAQLGSLKEQLKDSQQSAEISEAELSRSRELLAASEAALNQLSAEFEHYKASRDSDMLAVQQERNLWRIGAIGGGLAALAALIYAAVK